MDVLNVILLVVIVVAVLNGGVLAIWLLRRLRRPKIFISYRRRTDWATARNIRDRLRAMGASVFLDVEDIHEGRFGSIIEQEIAQRDHFIAVLAPGTLESEWVCREIETAIRYGKNVVPLLVGGFRFEDATLPKEIKALAGYNAIKIDPEFFDAAMDRLAVFVKLRKLKFTITS